MTYNVIGGTLNLTHPNPYQHCLLCGFSFAPSYVVYLIYDWY